MARLEHGTLAQTVTDYFGLRRYWMSLKPRMAGVLGKKSSKQYSRRLRVSDQTRNLNPHKPAMAAMYLYGDQYSKSRDGSMDFWDSLPDYKKRICRRLVENLKSCPDEQHDD